MRRYPAYKDSGVEWLGEVPEGWEVKCLRMIADELQTGPFGSQLHTEDYVTAGVPIVNPSNILDGQIVPDDEIGVDEATALRLANHALLPGDIILGRRGELGRCAVVPDGTMPLLCGTGSLRIRLKSSQALPDFIAECIRTPRVREWLSLQSVGSTMDNLNTAIVGKIQIALPSLPEQRAITAFLNRETAKIDALVEEQRRLIALLAEKRQAVLNHAVTRGLNPDALLKPSGIDWLGDIPEGWEVVPIRKVARLESGHTPSRSRPEWWVDCHIPWFSLADIWQVRPGRVEYVYETAEAVSELGLQNSSARLLPAGTVMLSRTASVGFSAVMGIAMATTQDFANWVCGCRLLPDYLLYCLRGMPSEFERLKMGSTHNTIYMPDIRTLTIPLPPLEEQKAIVDHVRASVGALDELMDTATTAITLLQERRAALISAAVTGKIDVRDLSPQSLSDCLEPA